MKKGNNFTDFIFDVHADIIFYSDIFDKIDNFAFVVLTNRVPVCDLGMPFGKIKSRKSLEICV